MQLSFNFESGAVPAAVLALLRRVECPFDDVSYNWTCPNCGHHNGLETSGYGGIYCGGCDGFVNAIVRQWPFYNQFLKIRSAA
jgi:hypothetical protein